MLSNNVIKLINKLDQKKYRDMYGLFMIEGHKLFKDIRYSAVKIQTLIGTKEVFKNYSINRKDIDEMIETGMKEIRKISKHKHPQGLIALCKIPDIKLNQEGLYQKLTLVLEDARDPGNLGTLVRIAEWFGIEQVICSPESVDVYNPKVVQASMGSIARVKVFYEDLNSLFSQMNFSDKFPLYGAMLTGDNIFTSELSDHGMILLGNESRGISSNLQRYLTKKIVIPSFMGAKQIDSLNMAVAGSILCAEFRKRKYLTQNKKIT